MAVLPKPPANVSPLRSGPAIDDCFRMAQQTLTKSAQIEKVQILLLRQMFILTKLAELLENGRRETCGLHSDQAAFGKKLQTVAGGILHEFVKVETVIMLAQLVMVKMFGHSRKKSL